MEFVKLIICGVLAGLIATFLSPLLAFCGWLVGILLIGLLLLEAWERLENKIRNKKEEYGRKW
jgi:uncharacterized membrane protein YeaQ/YmgE (transglycosylase-associated protein family)